MKLHRKLSPAERDLLASHLTKVSDWNKDFGGFLKDKASLQEEEIKLFGELIELEKAASNKTSGILESARELSARREALEMMKRAKTGQNSRLRELLEAGRDVILGMRTTICVIAGPMFQVRREEITEKLFPFFKTRREAEGFADQTVQVQAVFFYFQARPPLDGGGPQGVVTDEGQLFDDEETSKVPGPWSTRWVRHYLDDQAAAVGRLLNGEDLVPEFDHAEYASLQARNNAQLCELNDARTRHFHEELARG